jgi:hypothetical protein
MMSVRTRSKSHTSSSVEKKTKASKSIFDFAGIFKNEDFIDIERIMEDRRNFSLGRAF